MREKSSGIINQNEFFLVSERETRLEKAVLEENSKLTFIDVFLSFDGKTGGTTITVYTKNSRPTEY
jgi:hypothetical protein